jgi:hypothetical protein
VHRVRARCALVQGAEFLRDFPVLRASVHGHDAADRQIAQRGRDLDLLARGGAGCLAIRRAEALVDVAGEILDRRLALGLARLADDDEGREAERAHADETGAERRPLLARKRGKVGIEEQERARHRPFAGLGGPREDEGIRGVEPQGPRQLARTHSRTVPVAGSRQEGADTAGRSRSVSRRPSA